MSVILNVRLYAGAVLSDLEIVAWYNADMELCGGKLLRPHVSESIAVPNVRCLFLKALEPSMNDTQDGDLSSQLRQQLSLLAPFSTLRVTPRAHIDIHTGDNAGLCILLKALFQRQEDFSLDLPLEELVVPLPLFIYPVRSPTAD